MAGKESSRTNEEGPFRGIAIIGLGLMGASLAQAIKKQWPEQDLYGWDANPATLQTALEKSYISAVLKGELLIEQKVDLLILALPVSATLNWIDTAPERLARRIRPKPEQTAVPEPWTGALPPIVLDLCSIKAPVVKRMQLASESVSHWTWIGGHPLCGSEKNGINGSRCDLYENAMFFLSQVMPAQEVHLKNGMRLEYWLRRLRMTPEWVDPEKHDDAMAMTSHMPHLLSTALVRATQAADPLYRGPGFRDMTRIASGDPHLWQDILEHNKTAVLQAAELLEKELKQIQTLLRTGSRTDTQHWLTLSEETHNSMNIKGG